MKSAPYILLAAAALVLSVPMEANGQLRPEREIQGLEIRHGWKNRLSPRLDAMRTARGPYLSSSADTEAVEGQLHLPLLIVQMPENHLGPVTPAQVAHRVVGTPADVMSAREYYEQVSGDRFTVSAAHTPYPINMSRTSSYYVGTRGENGVAERLDEFLGEIASHAYEKFDWTQFDNDGPDGIPNSGDDDGIVDVVVIMYSTQDGSCSAGNNGKMWAHRWNLSSAIGQPFETASVGSDGQRILIDDYIAVPIFACDNLTALAPNGTLIHELGHVLGLPDLYPTNGSSGNGAGLWDLMATGNWYSQDNPASLGAWSRHLLGWVDEVVVPDTVGLRIRPVHEAGTVYRVPARDSDDYLLLEHRTRTSGIDAALPGEGLLIWQIDPIALAQRAESNEINNDSRHQAIAVVQADGANHLILGTNNGDAGDVWPGSTSATSLTHQSQPAAVSLGSKAPLGLRLDDIRWEGTDIVLDIAQGFSRTTRLTIDADIDGVRAVVNDTLEVTLPFTDLFLTGDSVTLVVDTADYDGTRVRVERWSDDSAGGARRTFHLPTREGVSASLDAVREYRVEVTNAEPEYGTVHIERHGETLPASTWVASGSQLVITASPTPAAERFLFWGADVDIHGDLAAFAELPAEVERTIDAPFSVTAYFAPDLPEGRTIDHALTIDPESIPQSIRIYLDALGNGDGVFDTGDLLLAIRAGRVVRSENGLILPSLPADTSSQ